MKALERIRHAESGLTLEEANAAQAVARASNVSPREVPVLLPYCAKLPECEWRDPGTRTNRSMLRRWCRKGSSPTPATHLGNGIMLLGLILIHGSRYFILLGGGFCLFACLAITAAEEQFPYGTFEDEYLRHMERVPRYFPRLWGLGVTMRGVSFDWLRGDPQGIQQHLHVDHVRPGTTRVGNLPERRHR